MLRILGALMFIVPIIGFLTYVLVHDGAHILISMLVTLGAILGVLVFMSIGLMLLLGVGK